MAPSANLRWGKHVLGTIIAGRYELLEEIGRGRLGIVYKARKDEDEQLYAVKILSQYDERDVKRFHREARAARKLSHPNVVRLLDNGSTADGAPFLVMELVHGRSLRNEIRMHTYLPAELAIPIFVQVCRALEHMHLNGIVHRDLKPANIMLMQDRSADDFVKLVDFGLALPADPEAARDERVTLDGYVTGTPAYMSPEQCLAEHVDSRSDIYSLGCVMFRTLTGIAPIGGATVHDTMNNQLMGQPTPFSRVSPDLKIDNELQNIVLRCLEKKREDRYQSAEDVRSALIDLLGRA